ncbi:glycosyltransferase family 2 protein [Thermodesulfobacteriota bacterium]
MTKARLPSLAMIMCVRDEEDFIGANLAYHHTLGVSRAYIFNDSSEDSTVDIVRSFPWAKVIDAPADHSKPFGKHQNMCADEALKMARKDGMDWLMYIDADEFAFAEKTPFGILGRVFPPVKKLKRLSLLERGNLRYMLKGIGSRKKQVILETKEVLPLAVPEDKPFWDLHYCHKRGLENREVLDPLTGNMEPLPWFGQTMGKSIVRTSTDVQAAHAHRWTWNQDKPIPEVLPLPSEKKGVIYHFVSFNAGNWLRKFRKHSYFPEIYIRGGLIDFPKSSWKIASARMSDEEAKRYFMKWLALSADEIKKYWADGTVTRETVVEDILRESGWEEALSRK